MKRVEPENDHIRNIANFDVLIAQLTLLGRDYRPSRASIQLSALEQVSANAKTALRNVEQLGRQYKSSLRKRELAFAGLELLMQCVLQELKRASQMNEIELHMLMGSSLSLSGGDEWCEPHDFVLHNLSRIIKIIKTGIPYQPVQKELQPDNLEAYFSELYRLNNAAKKMESEWTYACIVRDEVLYRERYGMVALSIAVKVYIKYHFGWESEPYRILNGLNIKKMRKRIAGIIRFPEFIRLRA